MSEPIGQILPGSSFGNALTDLAKDCETILEIGTWRGGGSTECLRRGLCRTTQRIWSVEWDFNRWMEAKELHKAEDRIRFLRAATVHVLDEIPSNLDLVLFDGGDGDSDTEFGLLFPRIRKYIALDDTKERKNRRQLELLNNMGWVLIHGSETERYGWAIFKKP